MSKPYQAHLIAIEKELGDVLTARFATGKVWRSPAGQIAGYFNANWTSAGYPMSSAKSLRSRQPRR